MSTLTRGETSPATSRPRHERRANAPDLSFAPGSNRERAAAMDWPSWTDRERWTLGDGMPLFDGRQGGGAA